MNSSEVVRTLVCEDTLKGHGNARNQGAMTVRGHEFTSCQTSLPNEKDRSTDSILAFYCQGTDITKNYF